jgi:uncharacterized protein YndB with AHSA1/START domain
MIRAAVDDGVALSRAGVLLLGGLALACAAPDAPAPPAGPRATTLLRVPLAEALAPGREAYVDIVELPPYGTIERHWHAGEEFLYGLQGEFEIAFDDGTSLRGGPGNAGHVPYKTWHRAVAGAQGAKVVIFRVHTQGQPLRSTEELPPDAAPGAVPSADEESAMRATKPSDTEILLTQTFTAPRAAVFAALTEPEQIRAWMKPSAMTLVDVEMDLRVGGELRYVFARPNGRRLEVRGTVDAVDPPSGFVYAESYDFSPLQVHVTMSLEEAGGKTRFTQRLRYFSQQERDADYPGVAESSKEAFAGLERHLVQRAAR